MITRAAVKIKFYDADRVRDIIIPCHRHCDAFQILKEFGYHKGSDYKELAQGFLNEKDEFLTRVEAYKEAYECHQLSVKALWELHDRALLSPDTAMDHCLYSEDLW